MLQHVDQDFLLWNPCTLRRRGRRGWWGENEIEEEEEQGEGEGEERKMRGGGRRGEERRGYNAPMAFCITHSKTFILKL
jgi:hypothetical protein